MTNPQRNQPQLLIRTTAYLTVGARQVLLVAEPVAPGGVQTYAGRLLPGAAPLSLKGLANDFLDATFDLRLPASFPDIVIDTLAGSVTRTPVEPAADATGGAAQGKGRTYDTTYRFEAGAATAVSRPFGASVPVGFKGFDFVLERTSRVGQTALFLNTTLEIGDLAWLAGAGATLVVASGAAAAMLTLQQPVSPADLIASLLSVDLGAEARDFLPAIGPRSATRPLRVAYATHAFAATRDGTALPFEKGLTVDDCRIEVLGYHFDASLQVGDGFTLRAGVEPIDLGFLKLYAPKARVADGAAGGASSDREGPTLTVERVTTPAPASTSIALGAQLEFFGDLDLDLETAYQPSSKEFTGTVTYDGSILGIDDPTLEIAWSKQHGFQLKKFPLPADQLEDIIDFAKEIEQLSKAAKGPCGELVGLAFDQAVTTTFEIHVAPRLDGGKPAIELAGVYTVFVVGHSIADIAFEPIAMPITIPEDFDHLATAIIDTLKDSASALAQGLWDNKEQLAELVAAQVAQKGVEKIATWLICDVGKEVLEAAIEEALEDVAIALAAEPVLDTLAAAALVLAGATVAIGLFALLVEGLSDAQKKKRDRAETNRKKAQAAIDRLLAIPSLDVSYHAAADNTVTLAATWGPANGADVDYLLTVAEVTPGDPSPQTPAATVEAGDRTTATVPKLRAGRTYEVGVQGRFVHNHHPFLGPALRRRITVPILEVVAPRQVYDPAANTLGATWQPSPGFDIPGGPVAVTGYIVEVWDLARGAAVPGVTATIKPDGAAPLHHAFSTRSGPAPGFTPAPGVAYQVRLRAVASVPAFSSAVWKGPAITLGGDIGQGRIGSSFRVG